MKKSWESIISLILVLVFVFQLLPTSSFAVKAEEDITMDTASGTIEEIQAAADTEAEDAYIVGEVEELRDETEKHFRMSDGTFVAVEYDVPVHYQDADGEWQNIDNTLQKSGSVYSTVNGEVRKDFSESLSSGQIFEMSYQNHKVGMFLVADDKTYDAVISDPIPAAERTVETEIPESMADHTEEIEIPAEATQIESTLVEQEAEISSDSQQEEQSAELLEQTEDAESVETSVPVEEKVIEKILPILSAETAKDGTRFLRVHSESVKANVENPVMAEKAEGEATAEEMMALDAQISEIRYENALKNTDLTYMNYGYNLKESIIIHEKQDDYVYSFSLALTELTPVMQEDGSVWLNDGQDNTIFEIPAPYMFDANDEISDQAAYTLTQTDSGYVLTVTADADWVNAPDRAFPVTVDPTLILHNDGSVKTTMLRKGSSNTKSPSYADLYCGLNNDSGYGICEIVLQVEKMPKLPNNCVVVNAQIMMAHAGLFTSDFGDTSSGSLTIQAQKLNSVASNVLNLTYNGVHGTDGLGVDDTVLDYQKLSSSTRNKYVSWDVTSAALSWIESDASKGAFLLTPYDHTTQKRFVNLIGHAWGDNSPYFAIQYRNVVGIEDYYTYQEASVGNAGNVYFSDFSNKMTIERQDVSLSLASMDFSISHYYNSALSGSYFSTNNNTNINTCLYTNMILGAGWKLSIQQTVVQKAVGKDTYLIYTDGDGTEHYFAKDGSSTTTFKDEDGLGLTIKKSTSGSNITYTMTDTDVYNTWVFYNGYLISHTDHNGNAIYIAYNNNYSASGTSWKPTAGVTNRIVQVVQHTDATSASTNDIVVATLSYNSSNFLTQIKDYAGRITKFTYSGTKLTQITNPDNTTAVYTYDSSNSNLLGAYDSEAKYGLEFTYWASTLYGFVNRTVNKVSEYAVNSSGTKLYGNRFHMYRNGSQLTSIRYYGADHTVETSDDLVVFNAFDYYGRTITSYTTDTNKEKLLGVTAGAYKANSTTNSASNNRLSKAASSGQHVENLILNSGLEKNLSNWAATLSPANISNSNAIIAPAFDNEYGVKAQHVNPHTGSYQLKTYLNKTATDANGYAYLQQSVSLIKGQTYTFSAYVNTGALTGIGTGGCFIAFMNGTTVLAKSEVINYYTDPAVENGWERLSVSYTPTSNITVKLSVCQRGATGTAAFDDVQLEYGDTMSSVNLIQDSSFDRTGGTTTTYWTTRTITTQPSGNDTIPHGQVIQLTGSLTSNVRVNQTVNINQASETTFLLSGWGKANSVFFAAKDDNTSYDRFFGLIAVITYTDGATETHYVPFSPMYTGWQYASGVVAPKKAGKTVQTIKVSCAYDKNANKAYFDNISLIQEPAQTYSYDSKGNPIAATTEKAKSAYEYFSGTSKLKSYTTPSGTKYTLTYKSGTNNVETETLNSVVTTMNYNASGEVTSTITQKSSSDSFLKTKNGYDASQNHKTSVTDVNGLTTTYGYSATNHLLTSSKIGNRLAQSFVYTNSNSRMSQTYISGYDALLYGYSSGRLSTLTRKSFTTVGGSTPFWQRYSLSYDAFGNNTAVKVISTTTEGSFGTAKKLAGYTYESGVNNGRLSKMTYANGNTVTYGYDLFDRVTSETYNSGTKYLYHYDAEGSLARQEAVNSSGTTTESYTYDYDSLGRLIHSKESNNGAMVQRTEHLYDTSNRLKKQNWMFGDGVTASQAYTYSGSDDTLTKLVSTIEVGPTTYKPTVTYTYNALRQLTRKTTGSLFYRAYAYKSGSETNQNTAQVQWMNYRKPSGDALILGYKYAYNGDGNISAVYSSLAAGGASSTANQTYTYDNLKQLSKVVDNAAGYTYNYSYDTAGNILTLKSTPTGGTATTKMLTYGDSVWKDRLTKVQVGSTSENITYETAASGYISGNPTSYYNGKHYDFTWQQGRQLATAKVGGVTTKYTYDMAGVRSSKTVGSTTYKYDTLSGLVSHQSWGTKNLYFVYDDSNQPYAVIYRNGTNNPVRYYYLLNLQGDVVGLLNGSGEIVATYRYDPWGVPTVYNASGAVETSTTSIGAINPLRYRGYFYDTDTGLYYLQSRYYDPAIGRFINADTFATTDAEGFLSCNMFAYCENDPVNLNDPDGTLPSWATKVIIGTAVIAAAAVLTVATGGTGLIGCFAVGALQGSAAGAVIGAVQGAATGAIMHRLTTGSWEGAGQAALNGTADGYMAGAITGFITGGLTSKACFVAGTTVLAATGYVAIENIKAGDYVWAWDEETGDVALKQVVETYVNESTELVHVFVKGEEIVTTPTHPFYSPVKGWTSAVHLRAGDILVLVNGEYVVVEQVQHELLEAPVKVYNFQVEGYHTYFVSNRSVLVHNMCQPKSGDYTKISTGRTEPRNLLEDLAMKSAKSNPQAGKVIIKSLGDTRFPGCFSKFQQTFNTSQGKIIVHYVGNVTKKIFVDFKFK